MIACLDEIQGEERIGEHSFSSFSIENVLKQGDALCFSRCLISQ